MYQYLLDENKLSDLRKKGVEFAQKTSWDIEGEKVFNSIMKGLLEDEECINYRR